MSDTKLS